ncbi:aminopeptidase P N-terminal domain-containing protein [Methylibium petroleiphilum]|uniref:aminopeptidase P N-terminal domain-containing protein n=1 Tax=Methylibium petroleiphilum TaxID=105560 RepID=UPI001AD1162E|nr:aminopeptidase P N-terminal domain-containing protein [Methylibium petroleiphilum]MBN9204955.1 aminopeptidase P N-terminal domain-containing protein [Methylibium petroleiphilum]
MSPSVYAERRARLSTALREAGGGIAVLPTAPERTRNADSEHPYRHDSTFYYLTGFSEPGALLVLDATGRSLLLCRPKDEEREIWDGYRLGPASAPAALGIDEAMPIEALDTVLPQRLANCPAVWFPFGGHDGLASRVAGWLDSVRARSRAGIESPTQQRDLARLIDEMRLFKDPHEVALMRRAGEIGAAGHVRAMQACRPGLREYQLEAELLHEFRRSGASGPAYTSIVAAGRNACVLHYAAGDAELRPGELCLIDAGCEYGSYASDITRTFPVDGRYTTPQRALYEVVLAAQEAAIGHTRPGARKTDSHWAAVRTLSAGLLDLGLLDRDRHGTVDDVLASAAYRRFYMHGTGHWLGLDVHDAGEYLALDEAPIEQPDGLGGLTIKKPSRRLQPGMVVTIEPGLYVRPAPDVPECYWHLGIRIEDDALVTPDGCELLSRGVPVRPDEIEALMRG